MVISCFKAGKKPALARANTGIERGLVMRYYQVRGGLVGVPSLNEPLVRGGRADGGHGFVQIPQHYIFHAVVIQGFFSSIVIPLGQRAVV